MKKMLFFLFILLIGLFSAATVHAADKYAALDGVKNIKAVFDVRGKNVKPLALQLDLIHKIYHDMNIRDVTQTPEVALVFSSGAVKLISNNRKGYTSDEKRFLGLIEGKLAEMAKDGIRLEVCLFAADVYDVDPATIPEHIHRVDNGWISIIGYQSKGYSLVAVF